MTNQLKLKAVDFSCKGKVDWDSTIKQLTQYSGDDKVLVLEPPGLNTSLQEASYYQCPHCKKEGISSPMNFHFHNLDKRVTCLHCKRSAPAKDLKCFCGTLWHLCNVHMRHTKKLRTSRPPLETAHEILEKAKTKRKADRLLNNGSYEQILEDDIEQAKNKGKLCKTMPDHSVIQFGNMHSTPVPIQYLSPALAMRFPGCCYKR